MWRFIVISLMLSSITGIALNILSTSIDKKQKYLDNLEFKIAKQNERMRRAGPHRSISQKYSQ